MCFMHNGTYLSCVLFHLVPCPFEPSCLWTGKLIPTNRQVINDHLFPDDYGWLPLTFTLTQTDNRTWIQQANGPLYCSELALKIPDVVHRNVIIMIYRQNDCSGPVANYLNHSQFVSVLPSNSKTEKYKLNSIWCLSDQSDKARFDLLVVGSVSIFSLVC